MDYQLQAIGGDITAFAYCRRVVFFEDDLLGAVRKPGDIVPFSSTNPQACVYLSDKEAQTFYTEDIKHARGGGSWREAKRLITVEGLKEMVDHRVAGFSQYPSWAEEMFGRITRYITPRVEAPDSIHFKEPTELKVYMFKGEKVILTRAFFRLLSTGTTGAQRVEKNPRTLRRSSIGARLVLGPEYLVEPEYDCYSMDSVFFLTLEGAEWVLDNSAPERAEIRAAIEAARVSDTLNEIKRKDEPHEC